MLKGLNVGGSRGSGGWDLPGLTRQICKARDALSGSTEGHRLCGNQKVLL